MPRDQFAQLVDGELPAAAALSDALGNPTAPSVGACLLVWNGTAWTRAVTPTRAAAIATETGILSAAPMLYDSSAAAYYRAATMRGMPDASNAGNVQAVGLMLSNGSTMDKARSVNTGQQVVTLKNTAGTEPAVLNIGTDTAPGSWNGLIVTAAMKAYGGTNLELWRNNVAATLLASAARTVTVSSADQINYNGQGVIVTVDVTAIVDTPSVVFTLEAKDPVSGVYTTVLASAAVVGVGTTRLRVGGAITAAANLAAADWIGRTWRVTATHADADSITYSVSAETMTA